MRPVVAVVVVLVVAAALALLLRGGPKEPSAPVASAPVPTTAPPPAGKPPATLPPHGKVGSGPWPTAIDPAASEHYAKVVYTPAEREVLVAAGNAIMAGKQPSKELPPASLEVIRGIEGRIRAADCGSVDCARYRIGVVACLDRAGAIRAGEGARRERKTRLAAAAMGVSVVTREIYYQTVPELIDWCLRMAALDLPG
jgi:hypothetical protein